MTSNAFFQVTDCCDLFRAVYVESRLVGHPVQDSYTIPTPRPTIAMLLSRKKVCKTKGNPLNHLQYKICILFKEFAEIRENRIVGDYKTLPTLVFANSLV